LSKNHLPAGINSAGILYATERNFIPTPGLLCLTQRSSGSGEAEDVAEGGEIESQVERTAGAGVQRSIRGEVAIAMPLLVHGHENGLIRGVWWQHGGAPSFSD
jgi:hypothetical protein